jgi:uncharacterized protein YdeI (YjbR/CyaY-like superfamily)
MKDHPQLTVARLKDWRAWLAAHHQTTRGVWLVCFKKHTGKTGISYSDALDEALCFGWIDSIVRRVDDDQYVRLFTPRRDKENWSEINKKKAAKLIQEGRMTAAGLAKMAFSEKAVSGTPGKDAGSGVPDYITEAVRKHQGAWENFNKLSPSCRRQYIRWITDAKKEETRQKRVSEAIGMLARNMKLGLK